MLENFEGNFRGASSKPATVLELFILLFIKSPQLELKLREGELQSTSSKSLIGLL